MEPVTIHEFVERGWSPPHPGERVLSLTQVRDVVVVLTDRCVYRAERSYDGDGFVMMLIGHL